MSDKTYKAKVGGKWLKSNGKLVKSKKDADTFESKTEPTQIINQMKKDGKLPKTVKPQVIEEERRYHVVGRVDFNVAQAKQMVVDVFKEDFKTYPGINLEEFEIVDCTNNACVFWLQYSGIRLLEFEINGTYNISGNKYSGCKIELPFSWVGAHAEEFKRDLLDATYIVGDSGLLSGNSQYDESNKRCAKSRKMREWENGDVIYDKESAQSLWSKDTARWKTVYNIPIEDGQTITDYSMSEGNRGTVTWFTKAEDGKTLKCVRSGLMAYSKGLGSPEIRFIDSENGDEFYIVRNEDGGIGESFTAIAL